MRSAKLWKLLSTRSIISEKFDRHKSDFNHFQNCRGMPLPMYTHNAVELLNNSVISDNEIAICLQFSQLLLQEVYSHYTAT